MSFEEFGNSRVATPGNFDGGLDKSTKYGNRGLLALYVLIRSRASARGSGRGSGIFASIGLELVGVFASITLASIVGSNCCSNHSSPSVG